MFMTKEPRSLSNSGLTLVEVVVATSIILAFLLVLFGVNNLYLRTAFLNTGSIKATFLAEEGLEAVRFLRDASWTDNLASLTLSTNYSLSLESNSWQISSTNIFIDGTFERLITFSDVYRDSSGDIVSSGGTLDPNTKLVTANVSWQRGTATTTKSVSTYITNIFDN